MNEAEDEVDLYTKTYNDIEDFTSERRIITLDLLGYMPPIEEDGEYSEGEGEDRVDGNGDEGMELSMNQCGSPFSPREIVKEEKSDKASESPRGTKDEGVDDKGCHYDNKEQQQQQQQQQQQDALIEDMGNKPSSL